MSTAAPSNERLFSPPAAACAWLWPGLGHIVLGEKRRGLLIMFGVLFLFFSGLLIGGFDAVDRVDDRLWFLAQALCGPIAFVADFINQSVIKDPNVLASFDETRTTGLARVNEIGTLFIALAGLMNLTVIIDALHFAPKDSGRDGSNAASTPRRRSEDQAA
ncbi:MAG: hypothetical protein EA377_00635 [Phycisphaerales bacterium]|nr:MAG: hypothetical protein EA377_00635 [Phycisphaerales bacterium]